MIRRVLQLAHRWIGLTLAVLLLPVALTGSALVWKEELDAALNPALFRAPPGASTPLAERELARRIERDHPPARISFVDLPTAPGRSARAQVRDWPGSAPPRHVINELFVDPATGAVLGARSTTTPGLNRSEFVPWVRRLHYTFHMKRAGMLLVGGLAIAWLLDCFVGAALTLPRRLGRWREWPLAWRVRGTRLNFDLHRAAGLWLWPVLVTLAASGIYLNLAHEVFVPVAEKLLGFLPDESRDATLELLLEMQYPLHTGSALGLGGRLLVSAAGLVIATLAITGLVTSLRKLRWSRGWR
jgi:uncharacterized iron-regulated membrane protein